MIIYFAWVYRTTFPHELQQELCALLASGRPRSSTFGRYTSSRARMHQRLYGPCQETVDDEKIFFDAKLRVQTFKVAGMVVFYAMTQYEVLSTSGRTDRVGLDKTHSLESAFQCGGLEKTASDRKAPQVGECDQHCHMLPILRAIKWVILMESYQSIVAPFARLLDLTGKRRRQE